ncbi:hypothetical protein Ms3S1_27580 [Methylosinus sp. 3S-1]|uniref:hypothetical protein n=1 Tax=Methylosinus trichosporium TaxID=426 RepID=UPI0001D2F46A|nr:hypothetical protein [Methylosinus trichosporium]
MREYTLGATLDRYVCYDKLAQLKALASKGPVQPLEAGVEHFFTRARLIRLSFRDVLSEVQQKIIDHLVASLRLWYLACASCPPQTAAIISVGDDFWVIGSFVAALDQADSLAPQPPFQIPVVGARVGSTLNELLRVKRLADTGPGRRRRDGMQLSDYVRVKKSDAAVKRLCAEEPGAIDTRLAAAWQGLCSANPTASQYELEIVKDGGECRSENVVACGLPRRGIQLNAGMYRFFDYRDKSVILGDGPQAIDLLRVTLHETGHWIGLRDSDTGNKEIMTGTYATGNCLGNGDVDALAGLQISGDQPGSPRGLLFPSGPGAK